MWTSQSLVSESLKFSPLTHLLFFSLSALTTYLPPIPIPMATLPFPLFQPPLPPTMSNSKEKAEKSDRLK